MLIIGVDTGGTFTDFIWKDGSLWGEYKTLSTPANPAEAVLAGIRRIAGDRDFELVHGSTVATNSILEKKGAKTALITNSGFEDVIEIARQNRQFLYDFSYRKNPPLVPRSLRFGLKCRVDAAGNILEALDPNEVRELLTPLKAAQVESIAVSLLFSFKNPEHERTVRQEILKLGIPISLSHETLAEFREYERTSTTVINAYVSPKMGSYITFLKNHLGSQRFRIMQSNGGSISAETVMTESVRTILSGPAGGAVGAFEIGKMAGFDRLITFDMGGTSTDVALIDGKLPLTTESNLGGYPVKVPMIDINTVGAGGGSIAAIDAGGALKVGPESAGADPGPICYGKGAAITVTDANLFLGRLVPDHFLGGAMSLKTAALESHFREMADKLGLRPTELAEGVLAVANTTMERAIKVISVERGFDPREFTLFSFGGAGGMHAAYLARGLEIPRVLIPRNAGILSAFGMLMSDIIKDYSQTVMLPEEGVGPAVLETLFAPLENRGKEELLGEGVPAARIRLEQYLDMRYRGQSFEVVVPLDLDFRETFHRQHERLYGYCNRDKAVEVVNLRLRAVGAQEKPNFPRLPQTGREIPDDALLGEKRVYFDREPLMAKVLARDRLGCGNIFRGPAIVVEYSSTIVVPPFAMAEVDALGNIILTLDA
ncbi:MAG: hydantoinase/oxoprolinase family protein [Desulfobaccales bacterium]